MSLRPAQSISLRKTSNISFILSITVVRPRLATTAHRRPCADRTGTGVCSRPCLPGYCEVASAGRTHGDRRTRREKAPSKDGAMGSATQTQTLDQRGVALAVARLEIVEQAATLADHLQQTAARMVVLRVALEVLCKVGNAF